MARTTISLSPEELAELNRLYERLAHVVKTAQFILSTKGMECREFIENDRENGRLWARIREILGESGKVI